MSVVWLKPALGWRAGSVEVPATPAWGSEFGSPAPMRRGSSVPSWGKAETGRALSGQSAFLNFRAPGSVSDPVSKNKVINRSYSTQTFPPWPSIYIHVHLCIHTTTHRHAQKVSVRSIYLSQCRRRKMRLRKCCISTQRLVGQMTSDTSCVLFTSVIAMGFIMAGTVLPLSASSMYVRCGAEKGNIESECAWIQKLSWWYTHYKYGTLPFERKTWTPDWIVLSVSQVRQRVSS